MNTAELRTKLTAVIDGLMNGTIDTTTAHEVSNAAGKYVSTIKADLMGDMMRHKIAGYSNDVLTLHDPALEACAKGIGRNEN